MGDVTEAAAEVAEETGGDRGEIHSHLAEMRALGVPMPEAKRSVKRRFSD